MEEKRKRRPDERERERRRRIEHQKAVRAREKRRRRKKQVRAAAILAAVILAGTVGGGGIYAVSMKQAEKKASVLPYEKKTYAETVYKADGLYASDLCVAKEDINAVGYDGDTDVHAAGLFDLNGRKVLYADRIHERLYPASTTKIMTALLALEKGNLSDTVTVGKNAAASSFVWDAQVCGLKEGDRLTLGDLLYGLLLHSGNDAGTAIAEHISGSEEAFVEEMNKRAEELMAVNTHFMNPHGLHDDSHYTTAYDLYLIFNECIKNEEFVKIIESSGHTVRIKESGGGTRTETWKPTNFYAKGIVNVPEGVTVVGGKTGTTGEAGFCLILLEKNSQGSPYISIVMGAGTKDTLYQDMSALMSRTDPAASAAVSGGEN